MSSTFKQDRPIRLNETADMTGEAEAKVTLTENHFVDNKIRIQCIAEIMGIKRYSNVYEKEQQVQSKAVTSHNFGLKSNNSDGLQPGNNYDSCPSINYYTFFYVFGSVLSSCLERTKL